MNKFKRKLAGMLAVCMVMTNVMPVFAEPVSESWTDILSYACATPSDAADMEIVPIEENPGGINEEIICVEPVTEMDEIVPDGMTDCMSSSDVP